MLWQLRQRNRFRHSTIGDPIEELLAEGKLQGTFNEIVGDIGTYLFAGLIEVAVVQIGHDSIWPAVQRHLGIQEAR